MQNDTFTPPFPDTGRTLFEIIDATEDGQIPTHGECYYAMLALNSLLFFAGEDSKRVAQAVLEKKSAPVIEMNAHWAIEEPFRREKAAFAKSPLQWIGESNLPGHPNHDLIRRAAKGLLRKVIDNRKADEK